MHTQFKGIQVPTPSPDFIKHITSYYLESNLTFGRRVSRANPLISGLLAVSLKF